MSLEKLNFVVLKLKGIRMKAFLSVLLFSYSASSFSFGDPGTDLLAAEFRHRFSNANSFNQVDELLGKQDWICRGKSFNSYSYELMVEEIHFQPILLGIHGYIEGSTSSTKLTTSPFDISMNNGEAETQYRSGSFLTFRYQGQELYIEQSSNTNSGPNIPALSSSARETTAYYYCM
jgi:hypothetical protein